MTPDAIEQLLFESNEHDEIIERMDAELTVARKAIERLRDCVRHHIMCGVCADDGCKNCSDCNAFELLLAECCDICKHSMADNQHGIDQNDCYLDADDNFVMYGTCTYCKECRSGLRVKL